ncbi:MAG: DUF4915 domain-containing protein, partial [Candidatus Dadabacteria bacterium]|nr:DUF4915 domain-containing protein [Candidatus Dadabacteria bacterium]
MPHSPRWHDGRLWLLESGDGSIGTVDLATGRYEAVARVDGQVIGRLGLIQPSLGQLFGLSDPIVGAELALIDGIELFLFLYLFRQILDDSCQIYLYQNVFCQNYDQSLPYYKFR